MRLQNIYSFIFITALAVLFSACNPTKKLSADQHLLNSVTIVEKQAHIDKSELMPYVKQKTNKKILGIVRFHLWMYNQANDEHIKKKKEKLITRINKKNEKRIAKGKEPKSTDKKTFGEWLMDVGEEPVAYDSSLTRHSSKQISLFLTTKGYFNNTVKDTVIYKKRNAKVIYTVHPGTPYKVRKIDYAIDDDLVKYYVLMDTANCTIKSGDNYDVDVFQKERERITKLLANNGYFYFSKEYVYYRIDSALKSHQLDVIVGIKKYSEKLSDESDSVIEKPHPKFYINDIFIDTDFNPQNKGYTQKDTLKIPEFNILYNKKLAFRPAILQQTLFISKGELYLAKNSEATYKRLSQLKTFRFVSIQFNESPGKQNMLDCHIALTPVMKQSFTIESEGTNSAGNLGVAGSFIYQNKNAFRGCELFEIKLRGALEVQKLINNQTANNISKVIPFNTIEFGPEASLYVPKFLVPFRLEAARSSNPKTIFNAAINFQKRPDYTRLISKISLGYNWKESPTKQHFVYPVEISFVQVELTEKFKSSIDNINNILVRNSYIPHLVTDTRWTFIYNDQDIKKSRNHGYLKTNLEFSGNTLRALYDLNRAPKDTNGSYLIFNIPFSQYIRFDVDYRFYRILAQHHETVFRLAFGSGFPIDNLKSLPFEKSFYGGGANGIRAWQIRTLGPGILADSLQSGFSQIGEMQLETNIEYRFKLLKTLNGAFFVDAGNIWLRKPDPKRPGAEFDPKKFLAQLAVGTGVGARLDFSFFIIRFDMGIKVNDPQQEAGERLVIGHLFDRSWKLDYELSHNGSRYSFFNFNLGIGYPF